MSAAIATPTTVPKFHFSLWVADLGRTVAFYRVLFGQEPHKAYSDYAKFEVAEPPLVLSFLPHGGLGGRFDAVRDPTGRPSPGSSDHEGDRGR